jgi:hypothetical protein
MTNEERMALLLYDQSVRTDLVISEEQQAALDALAEKSRGIFERAGEQVRQSMAAGPDQGDGGAGQARARLGEALRQAFQQARAETAQLGKEALAVLSEDQRGKLQAHADFRQEEATRRRSLYDLANDETAAALGLSDEQRGRIRDIVAKSREGMRTAVRDAMAGLRDLPPEERRARGRDLWRSLGEERGRRSLETEAAIMAVLTPEQQTAFGTFVADRVQAGRGKTITVTRRPPGAGTAAPAPAAGEAPAPAP